MELKYFVLGKKDNVFLQEYLDKYYQKLIGYLQDLSQIGILSDEIGAILGMGIENRNFIVSPDQSSLIQFLYKEYKERNQQGLGTPEEYIKKFKQEISLFLRGDIGQLVMNQGTKIAGTQIRLTVTDNNPYNKMEAHPHHQLTGGVLGWGEKKEQEWLATYEKTFALLKKVDEGVYSELNQVIKKIIPLGTAKGMHNSASYKECVGHLYMGYTIDAGMPEINNLEAIIHESSHNKLNLIMQFDPIVLNGKEEKYYSAIRPDARHIHGIFLGYHAFAPTMYIIMKAYSEGHLGNDDNWLEKIVLYYIKTKFLQKMIKKYAKLSKLGEEISSEVDYVVSLMDKLLKELNPSSTIIARAKEKQKNHFETVNKAYPYLAY